MTEKYESPLSSRYASEYMLHLFSAQKRIETWRRLWVSLAKAEMELGLPITAQQVEELQQHITDIDFDCAAQREKEVRHDVMAHVYTYGKAAPSAAGIIHLGATSCYVTDNADIVLYRDGLRYLRGELLKVIRNLSEFADTYKATPTLGYTHYQPAQLVTVGKRATLWMQDLLADLEELDFVIDNMKFLGCRGTTGTEASFVELFGGDTAKIDEMNRKISADFGFDRCFSVCGQTYPRKLDSRILNALSAIAQSCYRMANDIRLLQLPCPVSYDRRHERPHDSLGAVAGADAGRLRQPPHLHARGLPLRRCHFAAGSEHYKRPSCQRKNCGKDRPGVSALHRHGKPDDGGGQTGWQPAGAA